MWAKGRVAFTLYVLSLGGGVMGCSTSFANPAEQPGVAGADLTTRLAEEQDQSRALRTALEDSAAETAKLKTEIVQLKEHESSLQAELADARARIASGRGGRAPNGKSTDSIQAELDRERQRRIDLEAELTRLKEETSSSPYAGNETEEIRRLHTDLEQERAERRRLTQEVSMLQERGMEAARKHGNDNTPVIRALRARLLELEGRQQEAMVSLARTMAADRKREEDLNTQLAAARSDGNGIIHASAPATIAVEPPNDGVPPHGQNAELAATLEEERRRNAELAAKLKLASRVTDLLFRLQRQEVEHGAAAPAPSR